MKEQEQQIIYYSDELNDEFSSADITPRKIDGSYDYGGHSFKWKILHIFWYKMTFRPISMFILKFFLHHKIENKKLLKEVRGKPYFLYGNHTNTALDPFIPTRLAYPDDIFPIVHANNVSIPFLGRIIPYLGGLPLPDTMEATKNFMAIIKQRVSENHPVMIYPEAHIWPYYTKIRPFTELSFRYPVQYDVPTYCFTNTYQKWKNTDKHHIVTYIDGPFYPDKNLSAKEQKKDLRDKVFAVMTERAKNSNIEIIKYIKKEETNA